MNHMTPPLADRLSFDPARADAPAERSWWLSFTDLLAILLTFFVLAFAMGRPEPQAWSNTRAAILDGFAPTSAPSPVGSATGTSREDATAPGQSATRATEGGNDLPAHDDERLAFHGQALNLRLISAGLKSSRVKSRDGRLFVFLRTDELDRIADDDAGMLHRLAGLFARWPRFEEAALITDTGRAGQEMRAIPVALIHLAHWRERLTANGWHDAERWIVVPANDKDARAAAGWLRITLAGNAVAGSEGEE